MKRLEASGELKIRQALLKEYKYEGIQTCAVDGMCAINCPVEINTGDLIKRLRRENHSSFQNKMATMLARNFKLFEGGARIGIQTGHFFNGIFGKNFMKSLTAGVKKVFPGMPVWSNQIKRPGRIKASALNGKENPQVVYFSSCITRMMGGKITDQFFSVCRKANLDVIIPGDIKGTCCGQVFSSKGFSDAYRLTANRTVEKLWNASNEGKVPVVMDVTSCTQTIKGYRGSLTDENKLKFDKMIFVDIIEFAATFILPRLNVTKPKEAIVFHPVCSVYKMGSFSKLEAIGKACSKKSDIPLFAKCCGMAGDRGFYYPDLTASATKLEADEVKQKQYDGYYSSSTTCEMALSDAVGRNYESVLKLLDEVSE
jgi:D-lactate dehydrogenase